MKGLLNEIVERTPVRQTYMSLLTIGKQGRIKNNVYNGCAKMTLEETLIDVRKALQ